MLLLCFVFHIHSISLLIELQTHLKKQTNYNNDYGGSDYDVIVTKCFEHHLNQHPKKQKKLKQKKQKG